MVCAVLSGRAQAPARGGVNAAIQTNCRVARGVAGLDLSCATLFGPLLAERTPGQRRRPWPWWEMQA